MNKHKAKLEGLKRRQRRVRGKVSGTSERPRLRVTRTNANIYAQIIDDSKGSSLTLFSASTLEAEFKGTHTSNKEAAEKVGQLVGKRAIEAGIKVYNRTNGKPIGTSADAGSRISYIDLAAANDAICIALCSADGIAKADDPFQALKETLDALPDETMKKRVRHVVTEIERVRSFVRAFAQGDIEAAGRLFNASHDSLAADYEVTVPELDVAVDVARKNGAYGARMTGGGFGGSIIALVDKGRSQEVAQKIADEFEKQGFHAPRALAAYAAKSASREA